MHKPHPLIPEAAFELRRACSRPDGSIDLDKAWAVLHGERPAEIQNAASLALERAAERETAELLARFLKNSGGTSRD